MERCASVLTLTFGTTITDSCQLHAPAAVYTYRQSLVFIVLVAEGTSGLVNADRRNTGLENFQGPYRESRPEPSVLRRSAESGNFLYFRTIVLP